MYEQVEKPKENKSKAIAHSVAQKKSDGEQGFGFVDNRSEVVAQRKLQGLENNKLGKMDSTRCQGIGVVQRMLFHYKGAPFTSAEADVWNQLVENANGFVGTKAYIDTVETGVYDANSGVTVAGALAGLRALIRAGILTRIIDRNDADNLSWGEFAPMLAEMATRYGARTGPVATGGHAAQTYTYTYDGESIGIAEETNAHGQTSGNLKTRRGQMKNAIDLYNLAVNADADQYV